MTKDNKKETSLTTLGSTSLIKVSNSIEITNKIIKEYEERIINHIVPTVKIANQIWMSKNLDVDCYANGDKIPEVQNPEEWDSLKTGAWCYFNNDSTNKERKGKLYNWYAVNDPRGLAPEGYHIPSIDEWSQLVNYFEEFNSIIKSKDFLSENLWLDEFGFTSSPAEHIYIRNFMDFENSTVWWSSTNLIDDLIFISIVLDHQNQSMTTVNSGPNSGFSVRCIKN